MKRNRQVGIIICVGFLLSTLAGCNDRRVMVRDTDNFEITVADSVTKEPIEGVLFMGYWETNNTSWIDGHQSVVGVAQVMEAVTNSEGKIRVTHPKTIPDYVRGGYFGNGDPAFVLYKVGYKEGYFKNIGKHQVGNKKSRMIKQHIDNEKNFNEQGFAVYRNKSAYWNGRTIYLEPNYSSYARSKENEPYMLEREYYSVGGLWTKEQGDLKKKLTRTLDRLYQYTQHRIFIN